MTQIEQSEQNREILMVSSPSEITTVPCASCFVCGANGATLYHGISDRLCGVDGAWNLRRCSNERCGLLWLDPMPAETDLEKLYRNYSIHQYADLATSSLLPRSMDIIKRSYCAAHYGYPIEQVWGRTALHLLAYFLPGFRAQWDFSVFYLSAQPQGRLLDVGCGTGRMMKRLADLGWLVQGTDFDPKAVEVARSQGLNVGLGSLDEQNFDDNSFDAVVMSHVIEHVSDPRALLKSCKRVLKPGGQLVSVTPNAASWGHRLYLGDWYGLDPPRHLHIFTPDAMRKLAEDVSFGQLFVSSVIANAHGVLWSSNELKHRNKADPYVFSIRNQLWGRAMQMAEWSYMLFNPNIGEEIVMRAIK